MSSKLQSKRYKKGIFIGRFQPFHVGHRLTLELAYHVCDELVVGIGSAQESGTDRNPFPADIREEMIKAGLENTIVNTKRLNILKIPDVHDDDVWVDYILTYHPDIEIVFTDNDWVAKIFKKRKIETISPLFKRADISSTEVRRMIRKGDDGWERLVPSKTVPIINRHIEKVTTETANAG